MVLEVIFQISHPWLMREPQRPKLVLLLAGVSLWVLGQIRLGQFEHKRKREGDTLARQAQAARRAARRIRTARAVAAASRGKKLSSG